MPNKNEVKNQCCGRVAGQWRSHQCSRNGKLEHDGKFYCGLHHPPTVLAKRDAQSAAWAKEWEEKRIASAAVEAAKAEVERRAGEYPSLLAALQTLVSELREAGHDGYHSEPVHSRDVEAARAAIARALPQGASE